MSYLLPDFLAENAAKFPDREAVVHGKDSFSYANLTDRCDRFKHGLLEAGLDLGDRVAVYLEPCLEQVVAFYGALSAGAVFVPIHFALRPQQVQHILRDSDAKVLVTTRSRLATLKTDSAEALAQMTTICIDVAPEDETEGNISFTTFLANSASKRNHRVVDRHLAALLYTSGSTGSPKGVMVSHANLVAGADIVSDYLSIRETDRLLAALPFSFDAGLNQLTTALYKGGTIVLLRFLFGREIVKALQTHEITGLAAVPTLWHLITRPEANLHETELPHLRYVTNTGGALPLGTLEKLRRGLNGVDIFLMYGLTEAFRSTYLPPEELDQRPTSMGKAIPNTEIWVLDDQGKHCAPGEAGELVHRGPTVSLGYWGRPETTSRVIRENPFGGPGESRPDLVCYSGDLVKQDEDGFLYFIGRKDNMIKSSGFRISPTEVEGILFKSGHVEEAAVIGLADDELGQRVHAIVVPRDSDSFDDRKLIAFCAGALPRHMVPQEIECVGSLPKTQHGKIDYPALVAERSSPASSVQ